MPLVVTSLQQLIFLVDQPTITRSAAYQVKIAISGIHGHMNAQLEQQTNEYLKSCGCKEGMVAGILLLVFGWLLRLEGGWVFDNAFLDMATIFLVGAVAGKVGTYAVLRFKMAILLKRVRNSIIEVNKFSHI